jgi:molybdate transport system substrate-binding protein
VKRLALADPELVPAGRYARSWLERAGVWDAVRSRVVPTLDVRAALGAVESGAVDAAVVYGTDAALARASRVAHEVPGGDTPTISYSAAALAGRPSLDAARRFVAWLGTDRPAVVFRRAGFLVRAAGSP